MCSTVTVRHQCFIVKFDDDDTATPKPVLTTDGFKLPPPPGFKPKTQLQDATESSPAKKLRGIVNTYLTSCLLILLKKHVLTDPIVFPESLSTNQPYSNCNISQNQNNLSGKFKNLHFFQNAIS